MKFYLNLTLEEANRIIEAGGREYWAETRLARQLLDDQNSHGCFFVASFVKAKTLPENVEIIASDGQVIVITSPGHSRKPAFYWGKAILDNLEPLVREVKIARLLASVRQPRQRTVDSSAKPANLVLDRPRRA